jgi:hypothetical protein
MRLVHSAPAVWVHMRLVLLVACLGVAVNRQGPVYADTRYIMFARVRVRVRTAPVSC